MKLTNQQIIKAIEPYLKTLHPSWKQGLVAAAFAFEDMPEGFKRFLSGFVRDVLFETFTQDLIYEIQSKKQNPGFSETQKPRTNYNWSSPPTCTHQNLNVTTRPPEND